MKTRVIATLSALALAAALAPLTALPATGPTASYNLTTREYDADSAGEFDGRMHLNISSDGIVYGTYMNTEGQTAVISGGVEGTKIWIQIGHGGLIGHNYFDGSLVNGVLEAKARGTGFHLWTLEGKPAKH
jgi:hypothetical protein